MGILQQQPDRVLEICGIDIEKEVADVYPSVVAQRRAKIGLAISRSTAICSYRKIVIIDTFRSRAPLKRTSRVGTACDTWCAEFSYMLSLGLCLKRIDDAVQDIVDIGRGEVEVQVDVAAVEVFYTHEIQRGLWGYIYALTHRSESALHRRCKWVAPFHEVSTFSPFR